MIARFGVLMTIRTDNGSCYFSGTFERFANNWKINHVTNSPHYPERNELAEMVSGTIQIIWKQEHDCGIDGL